MNSVKSELDTVLPQHEQCDGDDRVLLDRAVNGDRFAFDRLVLKYRNLVLNLCVQILGNYNDGEDAAQETFVKAFCNAKTFRGDALVSTWIYRIAINVCKNKGTSWWSRLQKKALRLGSQQNNYDEEVVYELSDNGESVEDRIDRDRKSKVISAAIASLPLNFKELIVLRDIQDKSYDEISDITKLPTGTVKSRLARARDALQKKLKGVIDA
jgi:RNA polymerase sigma-70 factor (ECF subfamily)